MRRYVVLLAGGQRLVLKAQNRSGVQTASHPRRPDVAVCWTTDRRTAGIVVESGGEQAARRGSGGSRCIGGTLTTVAKWRATRPAESADRALRRDCAGRSSGATCLLLVPAVVFLFVFYGYPVAAMLLRSFNDPTWGWQNFEPLRQARSTLDVLGVVAADERLHPRLRHHACRSPSS